MRTLDEILKIRDYIVETNKFENINLFMGYSTEETIDKYIERFNLNSGEIKPLIISYYDEINTSTDKVVKINGTPLQMLLNEDEVLEYCKICSYSHTYYLKDDTIELDEGIFVAKEYENKYALAVDDDKHHLKSDMSYIEEHDEYVYSHSYKEEHYRFAMDDNKWHRLEDVTEVSTMPRYGYMRNIDTNYTQYVYDEGYLDDKFRLAYDDNKYHKYDEVVYIECDDIYVFDNDYLNDHYRWCEVCEEYAPIDEGEYLENYDIWVCDDCIDDHYSVTCAICGERIRDGEETYITNEEGEEIAICSSCEENDAAFRIDYDENADDYIGRYHCNNGEWKKYRCQDEDENVLYIGHELEVEPKRGGRYNLSRAATAAQDNLNCILSRDGSLRKNGFEIVSQPQSYKYIMEHYSTYEKVFEEIVKNGYVSHNSGNCGLHFHVTAPKEKRDEIVGRLWLIIETYKDEFKTLSRRRGEFGWCKFLSTTAPEGVYKLAKISKDANSDTRYLAINDRNTETIEIRLFKGTLNPKTFFADLQLVHNLFTIAYNLDMPITDVTFDMLIEGDIISEYCKENNIYSDKRIEDDSAKYIVLENKIINLTKNILDIMWKEIEETKELQYKYINKKAANSDSSNYYNRFRDYEEKLSTSIQYYVRAKSGYDKRDIAYIIYCLNDIKYYTQDETIKKKIKKIYSYNEKLVA